MSVQTPNHVCLREKSELRESIQYTVPI